MTISKIELARVLAAPPIAIRAELLKAWLALTFGKAVSKPIRCQGIKRWLTLTMLRATGPRASGARHPVDISNKGAE